MKRIMVVDNHPVVRRFMSDLIEKQGHDVATAEDGLTALRALESFSPDLIFADVVMPNIDGNKLCQIIRSRENLNHCFIVLLTGTAVEEEAASIENLWADLILAKGPFDRLAWHVDYIIKHMEAGHIDRLKGEIIGTKDLSARQIVKELMSSKRHFEQTLNNMSEGLLELTPKGEITYANPAALSIIGKSEESLLASDFVGLFKNEEQAAIRQRISGVGRVWQEPVIDEILDLGGKLVEIKILTFHEKDLKYTLVAMLKDVTRQKQAECSLREEKEKYQLERNFLDNIFENSPDAIAIVDEHGRFIRWNHKAAELFGYNFEELKGKKAFQMYADRRAMEKMLDMLRQNGGVQNHEIDFIRKDGSLVPCAVSISLLYNELQEKTGSLSIIRDLSDWKAVEERLRYMSFHDSLTGLYNRAFFEEEMNRLAKGGRLPLAIIICDIDKLKEVNDTMGHQKGDELIKGAAEILRQSFRSSDIIARIGGDEFAVLLPYGDSEGVEERVKSIREGIETYNSQRPEARNLSISIGYGISAESPVDMKALFKKADDNMYLEKGKKV